MADIFEKYTEEEIYEALTAVAEPERYWMGIVYYCDYEVPEGVSELEPGLWRIVRDAADRIIAIQNPSYEG